MTIATGEQATAADVLAAIAAARTVATGTYTGTNSAGRQITVGFLPKLVIIIHTAGGTSDLGIYQLIPNATIRLSVNTGVVAMALGATNTYIHASAGFVVSNVDGSNDNGGTYYYFAIKD